MVQFKTWVFRAFLGLMWVLPIWVNSTPQSLCNPLETVREQLNSSLRRRFMKQNFPINYTIPVRYEQVYRLRNISRLMKDENVNVSFLQDLWLKVARVNIKKILQVLPERHPTRLKYLTNLENLFKIFEQQYEKEKEHKEEPPEVIEEIYQRLDDLDYQGWRYATPKSLLDNCYRALHCLFKDCFSKDGEHDYCNIFHWRKGNETTTPQPA